MGDLPFLQDDTENAVWERWAATWRDLQVVDAGGTRVAVYSLTEHDLADPDNYDALLDLLLDAVE